MPTSKHNQSIYRALLILLLALPFFAAEKSLEVTIESGTASFEAGTNVPGIEIKGASSLLSGRASVSHDSSGLLIEQIHVTLPVKSLATGMKVRDEHMRKYIFTTAGGQLPDVEFSAAQAACRPNSGPEDFTCQVAGDLSIRGVSHAFSITLNVKEQESGSTLTYRAIGDGVVRLSDYGIAPPSQFGVSATNEVKLRLNFGGRQAITQTAGGGGVR
jgi:polyisoprenoid-binding protein YceI